MFPVGRLVSTVSEMMIGWPMLLERTISTRRHDTVWSRLTKVRVLATTAVSGFRGASSFATTCTIALSFASSSFATLKTFDIDLGVVHRLDLRFTLPLPLGIGESNLLGCMLLVSVLKPTR